MVSEPRCSERILSASEISTSGSASTLLRTRRRKGCSALPATAVSRLAIGLGARSQNADGAARLGCGCHRLAVVVLGQCNRVAEFFLVEGGVAGTIEIGTLRPLDFGKRRLQGEIKAQYNPYGDRITGGSGGIGWRGTLSYVDQFANDTIGIAIGESISVGERSLRVAQMLGKADIIIESAVALTQEIHDGPFETYTGHGIWSHWKGMGTYSLKGKTLIRIDLDENLRKAQDIQKESKLIQEAIDKGLPKTKIAKIPFRMEMSAFARHEGSIPIIGDIGKIWPLIAATAAERLGVSLEFMSYSQETDEGRKMRDWIVENVAILDRAKIRARAGAYASLRVRPGDAR